MDRLDLQHQLWLFTLNNELFNAPTQTPQNILDIGTGTGIWAIEVANKYPTAHVIGTDLSPIQPSFVPPNCEFQIDDFDDDWNYSQTFDLIHARAMVTCFKDPLSVIVPAFHSLAPGGYLELQDFILPFRSIDNTLTGTKLSEWATSTFAASIKMGLSWDSSQHYSQYLEEAGFVDVVEQHFQWPLNQWPKGDHMKLLGEYFCEDMTRTVDTISMPVLTKGGGMTPEEARLLCMEAKIALADKSIHAYCPMIVVYGRKPGASVDGA